MTNKRTKTKDANIENCRLFEQICIMNIYRYFELNYFKWPLTWHDQQKTKKKNKFECNLVPMSLIVHRYATLSSRHPKNKEM